MPRATAFGADPTGSGQDQGQIIEQPIPGLDPLKQIARDIAAIKDKYAAPEVLQPTPFQIPAGETRRHDMTMVRHNSFTVCVFTGTVDLWFGEGAGNGAVPHIQYLAGQGPVQVMVPDGGRVYTLGATAAGAASFTFTPMQL